MSLLLNFLIILSSLFSTTLNQEMVVTSSYCYFYSQPSFISEKIQYDDNDFKLFHNDKVIAIKEEKDFIFVQDINTNIQGYVYKYYLTNNTSQTVYPVFNATIRNEAIIYDMDKSPTSYMAKEGQRVFLYNGFDDSNDGFTSIQIVLEDGSLYNGYIKSENINPDGVSSLLIIGISTISAFVTIILSLVFIKKTKKQKSK